MTPTEYAKLTPIQKDDFVSSLRAKHVEAIRKELGALGMMELAAKIKEAGCYNRMHLESKMLNALIDAELMSMSLTHPAAEQPAAAVSAGHIGFAGSFEYFWAANGDLYRANKNNPLDTEGYRMGARYEANEHTADYFLTQAGLH